MNNFTVEIQGHDLIIKTPNGGWETRNRYTGRLTDFSINPELDFSEYKEIDRQIEVLVQRERDQAKQVDQKLKKGGTKNG